MACPYSCGDIGIFQPGAEFDGLYPPASMYLAATFDRGILARKCGAEGKELSQVLPEETELLSEPLLDGDRHALRRYMLQVHAGTGTSGPSRGDFCRFFLGTLLDHHRRHPHGGNARGLPNGRALIVRRARDIIEAHIAEPICMDAVAAAAETSRRTLFRSFEEVLGESPHAHATRLRLHDLRKRLVKGDATRPVSEITRMAELGGAVARASMRYRELFGERPSSTRDRAAPCARGRNGRDQKFGTNCIDGHGLGLIISL